MKKFMWRLGGVVAALAGISTFIDSQRDCDCDSECWCKQPGLRQFRWVLPIGHKAVSPEWKPAMEVDPSI